MDGVNELLQRCDKKALVGVIGSLCVKFQEILALYLDDPEETELELDSEEVKIIVHKALLKLQVAEKCQQYKDRDAFMVALGAHEAAGEPEVRVTEAGCQEGGSFLGILAVSGEVLSLISTFLSGDKEGLLCEWKAMFQEHRLEHCLDEPLNTNHVDYIIHEYNTQKVHIALPNMEIEDMHVSMFLSMPGLTEVLQRCDKNALVGSVERLCVMFQEEYLGYGTDMLDILEDGLDDESVTGVIYEELFEMQVAQKCQQDRDRNSFLVAVGAGVAPREPDFHVAEAGGRERSFTGLLVVSGDVLSLISFFLNCENVELLREWVAPGEGDVGSCHVSSCSSMVLSSVGNVLYLWDAASGMLKNAFEGHTNFVRECQLSPNGKTVVSASYDGTLKVWDVASGSLVRTLVGHTSSVLCVAVSPDNARILSGSYDGTWNLWNSWTGELQHTEQVDRASWCSSFSPNGSLFVVGCYSSLRLHDSTTCQLQHTFAEFNVQSCSFAPDGATILTCGETIPGKMTLWSTTSGQCLWTNGGIRGGTHGAESICSCSFSPSGHEICIGTNCGMLMVWSVATGLLEETIDADDHISPTDADGNTPLSVCVSSDGKHIASSQCNGVMKIWRVRWRGSVK
jgi:WD40 repeat protein